MLACQPPKYLSKVQMQCVHVVIRTDRLKVVSDTSFRFPQVEYRQMRAFPVFVNNRKYAMLPYPPSRLV